MNNPSRSLLILVFFVFIFLGFLVGTNFASARQSGNIDSIESASFSGLDQNRRQYNTLVIIGSKESNNTFMPEGAWIVLHLADSHRFTVIPVQQFTNEEMQGDHPEYNSMLTIYSDKTLHGELIRTLWDAGIFWDYYILMDAQGFADLDLAFELSLKDHHGKSISPAQLENSSQYSNYLIQQACMNFNKLISLNPAPSVYQVFSEHSISDISVDQVSAAWTKLQSAGEPALCRWIPADFSGGYLP